MIAGLREFTDTILIDWLPDVLREKLDQSLAAGVSREKMLGVVRKMCGGDSFTYLAVWAYLEKYGGGPLAVEWEPHTDVAKINPG